MTNGFYILPSFYEAVSEMPPKDQGELWVAVIQYGMTKTEPTGLKKHLKPVFTLIKPVIDAQKAKANQARENGSKGGRKKITQEEPKANPEGTEEEPKPNPEASIGSDIRQGIKDKGIKNKDKGNILSPFPSPEASAAETPQGERELLPDEKIDCFARLWAVYPRKENKVAAAKEWNLLKPDAETVDRMIAAVRIKANSAEWKEQNGRFVPHLDRWLSERRWEDIKSPEPREMSFSEKKAFDDIFGEETNGGWTL